MNGVHQQGRRFEMIFDFCDDYTMTVMAMNIRHPMDVKMNAMTDSVSSLLRPFFFFIFFIYAVARLLK